MPGVKRQGTTKIDAVTDTSVHALPAPAMSCQGDSGGPVFLTAEGGVERLIAITAKGDPGCKEYAFNVRVDAVRDFIDAFVAETETTPIGPPAGTMGPEEICAKTCATNADCPAAMLCLKVSTVSRCALPGTVPARFGVRCSATEACAAGATCARLWASGDFQCLCATPCPDSPVPPDAAPDAGTSDPPPPADEGGCLKCRIDRARGVGDDDRVPMALALSTLALGAIRRRRRRAS